MLSALRELLVTAIRRPSFSQEGPLASSCRLSGDCVCLATKLDWPRESPRMQGLEECPFPKSGERSSRPAEVPSRLLGPSPDCLRPWAPSRPRLNRAPTGGDGSSSAGHARNRRRKKPPRVPFERQCLVFLASLEHGDGIVGRDARVPCAVESPLAYRANDCAF